MRKMRNKTYVTLLLTLCLLLTMAGYAFANSFTDVQGHWAQEQINKWSVDGLASGYADGTFKPNNQVTRAEFVALVNRAFDIKNENATTDLIDVKPGSWYYENIAAAKAAGYIGGYTDGTFRPGQTISRQEVASILVRLLKLEPTTEGVTQFEDSVQIPEWSRGNIGAVNQTGLMRGMPDNTFQPLKGITRAEAVVSLDRALEYAPVEVPQQPSESSAVEDVVTVTFDSNGGSAVAPITNVTAGATVTLPAAPTRSGFTFNGWYTDNTTFANAFTSAAAVKADVTVYAKWTAVAVSGSGSVTVSGTLTDGATEQEVQNGNQTIVLTLKNVTFAEDMVSNETKRDALLAGLTAGRLYNEAYAGTGMLTGDQTTYDIVLNALEERGWTTANDQLEWAKVISAIDADPASIVLNGDHTQVTITIPAVAGYDIFLSQTIQVTVPDDVLVGAAADLTAVKPFSIDAVLGALSWNGQNENDIVAGGKVLTLTTTWSGGFAKKVGTLDDFGGRQSVFIDYFVAQSESDQWAKVKSSLYNTDGAVILAPDFMSATIKLPAVTGYNITNAQQIRYYFSTGLIGQTGGASGGIGARFPIGIAVPIITIDCK